MRGGLLCRLGCRYLGNRCWLTMYFWAVHAWAKAKPPACRFYSRFQPCPVRLGGFRRLTLRMPGCYAVTNGPIVLQLLLREWDMYLQQCARWRRPGLRLSYIVGAVFCLELATCPMCCFAPFTLPFSRCHCAAAVVTAATSRNQDVVACDDPGEATSLECFALRRTAQYPLAT